MATQQNTQQNTQQKQVKASEHLNTFTSLRKTAKMLVKTRYAGDSGFEAWQELDKVTQEVLSKVSKEEIITTFYKLAVSNSEISWFISNWGK